MPARDDKKAKELEGKKFGKLEVIKFIGRRKLGVKDCVKMYLCKCDCGNYKEISAGYLTIISKKSIISCGCQLQAHYDNTTIDLTNQVFGKLTARKKTDVKSTGKTTTEAFWECDCECGNKTIVRSGDLRKGDTSSCGCNKNNREHKRKYEPMMANVVATFRKYNNVEKGDTITIEEFLELSQMICNYCGAEPKTITNTYAGRVLLSVKEKEKLNFVWNGLDRVNNELPHISGNCVPCCTPCNTAKMDHHINDFRDWAIEVFKHFILGTNEYSSGTTIIKIKHL